MKAFVVFIFLRLSAMLLSSDNEGSSNRFAVRQAAETHTLYRQNVTFDNVATVVQILDSSCGKVTGCLYGHNTCVDALVLVYSICECSSFYHKRALLETLVAVRGVRSTPLVLLGNKHDKEHCRKVGLDDDGHEASLHFHCQLHEVSAVKNYAGVSLALQSLIPETRALQVLSTLPVRGKAGVARTVFKMIGLVFSKPPEYHPKTHPHNSHTSLTHLHTLRHTYTQYPTHTHTYTPFGFINTIFSSVLPVIAL
ncbi:hypothetical protein HPB48_021691 [Haemaphysalis longicornis]|uniref:small monomeric GTPase n=1 Tax=Haemaphysalis longicornis TaxID=44386 RepID=A0A9J6H0C2_HAELO|nr:hypothetical protein HPB48_021691 [Haemaphysalis longicornis]